MSRYLVLTFEVDDSAIPDDALEELAERIVAEQVDPDPAVLVWQGCRVERGTLGLDGRITADH